MTQLYHKGKYRTGGWSKHPRPYLKRLGNKRWRKDAVAAVVDGLDEERLVVSRQRRKKAKVVKVKITMTSFGGFTFSYIEKYATLKEAEQSIKRHEVVRVFFYDKVIKE